MKKFSLLTLLLLSLNSWAQMTPVGSWHTVDDETGKPSAEIRITDKGNGELSGIVIKSLLPPKEQDEKNCSKCTDDRKDKSKIGMEIIRGAKQTADSQQWEGGYIGPFYRTQTWNRVNPVTPSN